MKPFAYNQVFHPSHESTLLKIDSVFGFQFCILKNPAVFTQLTLFNLEVILA